MNPGKWVPVVIGGKVMRDVVRFVPQEDTYDAHERITDAGQETEMDPKKEALERLNVQESVTLDCCNSPNGVTNCPELCRTKDGFALVGDDGSVVELSNDQMTDLVERGSAMLDSVE